MVGAAGNSEVGQGDLERSTLLDVRNAEVLSLDLLGGDLELEVAAVVSLGPLQRRGVLDDALGDLVGGRRGDVLAEGRRGGHGRSGEFDTDGAGAGVGVVGGVVEPGQVADPVDVGVTREHDVVADVVLVESLQGTVPVGQVAVPSVHVEWLCGAVLDGLVQLREDCDGLVRRE